MTKQATLFPQKESTVVAELSLAEAAKIANEIEEAIETYCDKVEVAGSIRRQKPSVHDIDFVVVAKSEADWTRINEVLKRLEAKRYCSGNQTIKAYLPCQTGFFQVDIYRAKPSTFGIQLLIRTGSAEHNMWLAGYSISKGMRLKYSEGLIKDSTTIAGQDEKGMFSALGLPFPLPAEREIVNNKPMWLTYENHQ